MLTTFLPSLCFHHSLVFVLYMSVRIRSENLIQEKFTRELNNNVPVANDAVAAVSYKYQKPPEQAEASIV